jgi:SAM-dependent methyltransferase
MTATAEVPASFSTDALVERLFGAAIEAMDLAAVYLGDRLGLYKALHTDGPATVSELVARTGTTPRYVQEWLEQQVTTGILTVDDAYAPLDSRRFGLPPEHAEALVEPTSLASIAPLARAIIAVVGQAPGLLEAFRSGDGLPWSQYGADMREAQSDFNRPLFQHQFVQEHLSAIPGLDEKLSAPNAKVAEVGFGGGWASISIANAYPGIQVDGFDNDAASVALARENAARSGVSARTNFEDRNAGDASLAGQYDLVFAFECVHDMANPVEALATMRRLAAPGGVVLVVDERVADSFGDAIGDPIERMMYGWSVLACLSNGLSDKPSAGTGTVFRQSTLEGYASRAGFSRVDVLPIEHDLFRFYQLVA